MCKVFLLQDLGVFELQVEEASDPATVGDTISQVLNHLPARSDAVVDLRDVCRVDLTVATSLAQAIRRRRRDGVRVVAVSTRPEERALLAMCGIDAETSIASCPQLARSMLLQPDADLAYAV